VLPLDLSSLSEAAGSASARKSVLRQQSYKLAQQTPVLPPLPALNPPPSLGLEPFRPIDELHAHAEEEEDEEEEDLVDTRPWPIHNNQELSWQTLPTTMAECKLTDSNSSLSRLSPLLHLHQQTLPPPIGSPFRWVGDNSLHPPPPQNPTPGAGSSSSGGGGGQFERMDTSGP
jgi:hypothetical protein